MSTLPMSDIVSVQVQVSPTTPAASALNLGLIIGPSTIVSATTRVTVYPSTTAMLTAGFTTSSPEYIAAQLYFGQSPRPSQVAIGRQDLTASESFLTALAACRVANQNWYGLYLAGATSADIIACAPFVEAATPPCAFFYATSDAAALAATALTAGYETGASAPSANISAGTATTFKIAVDNDTIGPTYQSVTLTLTGLTSGALIAAAMQAGIRALGGAYAAVSVTFTTVYVITSGSLGLGSKIRVAAGATNDVAATLKIGSANSAVDTDGTGSLALSLQNMGLSRTIGQYSTTPHAVASIMGYAMAANTTFANSAYTLAYKSEPGVATENLTEDQVLAIKAQNCNVYVNRGNNYNFFEKGVMANGRHFDEIIGIDRLAGNIQNSVLALLASVPKIPQTDGGVASITLAMTGPCETARTTGFVAPGEWTGPPILTLSTGDTLPKGYAILTTPISSQGATDRATRIAPPIYVCIKEAGAIEGAVIQVNVNQ